MNEDKNRTCLLLDDIFLVKLADPCSCSESWNNGETQHAENACMNELAVKNLETSVQCLCRLARIQPDCSRLHPF